MDNKSRTSPRSEVWVALLAMCCILFWSLGYNAAKFANGVPIDLDIMDVIQIGCVLVLAGFVLRRRQWLR